MLKVYMLALLFLSLLVNNVREAMSECEVNSSRGSVIRGASSRTSYRCVSTLLFTNISWPCLTLLIFSASFCRLSMCCGTTWGKNMTATMMFSIQLSMDLNQVNG